MSKTIATHDGKFHADDVFAVAFLLLLEKEATVTRTRDGKEIGTADIVVDVGGVYDEAGNRFDHHQKGGAGVRQNGIPYASFGLVWKKYGKELCQTEEVAHRVEQVLVVSVDANDNGVDLSLPTTSGVSSYELADVVRAYIPTWLETVATDMDTSFGTAVSFAKQLINREIRRAEATIAGQRKVTEAYESSSDKRLVILEGDYSWKDILAAYPEPLYVVHPQGDTWRVYAVRDNPHQFVNRKDLPEGWAGLREEELRKVAGVPDAVFCHRNRFMAVARSREGALALAQKALMSS